MRHRNMTLAAIVLLGTLATTVAAQTEFTYQGSLEQNGAPANATFSFEFALFDAATGGSQIGATFHAAGVVVQGGLFTTEIDFGAGAFDGAPRWVEISVREQGGSSWTTLAPRQPLTAAPYALYALQGPGVDGGFWSLTGDDIVNSNSGNVGIGLPSQLTPDYPLEVISVDATRAIYARDIAFTGPSYGVYGETWSNAGTAVHGWATHASGGVTNGVYGRADSPDGYGVYGFAWSSSGANAGVYGRSNSSTGRGVYGRAQGASAFGGYFEGRGYFSGNVGIGTTTPSARLEIAGTPGVDGIRFPDGTLQTTAGGGGGGGQWTTGGGGIYYNGGNVGIGTTAPAFNLHARRQVPGGSGQPAATFGVQWSQQSFPANEDWLSFRVGGTESRPAGQQGTHIVRPTGKRIHFSMEDSMNAGALTPQLTLTENGRLGVGTTSPAGQLDVLSTGSTRPARIMHDNPATNLTAMRVDTNSTNSGVAALAGVNSESGIGVLGQSDGGHGVRGVSTTGNGVSGISESANGYGGVFGDLVTPGRGILAVGDSHFLAPVAIGTTSVPSGVMLDVAGTARVAVLEIDGGADLSEGFEVAGDEAQPGMVVVIDPANPGQLRLATQAYDRKVAGIVSGAGGVKPGMVMKQAGSVADGEHPVALTGRVYCYADATEKPIQPGDLLVTSDTPGHAMKASDYGRSQGAILGKAMTGLAAGETGLVLVLVGLQ